MRVFLWVISLSVLSGLLFASETNPEELLIRRAKEHLAQVQKLVDVGAAPRAQVAQAQDQLADAEDAAVLRKTV